MLSPHMKLGCLSMFGVLAGIALWIVGGVYHNQGECASEATTSSHCVLYYITELTGTVMFSVSLFLLTMAFMFACCCPMFCRAKSDFVPYSVHIDGGGYEHHHHHHQPAHHDHVDHFTREVVYVNAPQPVMIPVQSMPQMNLQPMPVMSYPSRY